MNPSGVRSRPAPGDVRVGERVERRVDLDRVEPLGVVAQALLRRRDAARVPRAKQPLVGPAARADANGRRHATDDTREGAGCGPSLTDPVGLALADGDELRLGSEPCDREGRAGDAEPLLGNAASQRDAASVARDAGARDRRARLEGRLLRGLGKRTVNVPFSFVVTVLMRRSAVLPTAPQICDGVASPSPARLTFPVSDDRDP